MRTQKFYTVKACENLMSRYIAKGGEVVTLKEGGVGLGLVMCYGNGFKTSIIKERFVNSWDSVHTIRMYKRTPKKYLEMLKKALSEEE